MTDELNYRVAAIMPTYNAAEYLRECLDSFKVQTFEDWELVCVDKGSDDGTLDILNEYARGWPRLRVLVGGDERTSQINRGVRASSSEFIYYTAADFRIDPTLIADAVRAIDDAGADCAYINCISFGDGFWARVRDFERSGYFGTERFEGTRFFRRSLYEQVGGYDDAMPIFEEFELQDRLRKAGARFARVVTAAEYHLDEPKTLGDIWRRSFYIGSHYGSILKKEGPRALRHANPIRASFFRGWRRFYRNPDLALGFVLLLLAKYAGGACGFLLQPFVVARSHRARGSGRARG